jgi:hypothetical protein
MKRFLRIGQWGAATAVALLVNGSVAHAALPDLRLCQLTVELETNKFEQAVALSLRLCADKIRGAQILNTPAAMQAAVNLCEAKFKLIWDVQGLTAGDKVTKFKAKMDALFNGPPGPPFKCDPTFLLKLGHFQSPSQAPGSPSAGSWMATSLLNSASAAALNQEIAQVGDAMSLIAAAQTFSNVDCSQPVTCLYSGTNNCRPNLCKFGLECFEHACTLTASSATVNTAFLPSIVATLSGRSPFGICVLSKGGKFANLGAGYGDSGFQYSISGPSKTLDPVVLGSVATVCVYVNRAEGYCNCGGAGVFPKNVNICQDRIVQAGTEPVNDQCGSLSSLASPETQNPYAGTKVGLPKLNLSGTQGTGDCLNLFTTQFAIITGTCGTCSGCCGADGLPCTSDDLIVPQAPASVPLTTGTATTTLFEAVASAGGCSGDFGATSCVEDSNCTGAAAPFCNTPSPVLTTLTAGPVTGTVPGAPVCAKFDASTMSGVKFVGAFPAGGGGPPLGDTTTSSLLWSKESNRGSDPGT